jgi:crotonobetaine/carnitine-CoA ligase
MDSNSFLLPFAGLDAATLLDQRARQRGDHPFLVWAPFDAPARRWSYAQFAADVARVAGGLAARGVRRGDKVLVQLENCPELLLAWFACARLGAVCSPCNAAATGPELAWFAELTGASCAVTQPRLADVLAHHCTGLKFIAVTGSDAGTPAQASHASERSVAFDTLFGEPLPSRPPEPMAPAAIMFTSGTTSRSKGVLWTHANALWGAKLGALQQGLRADDVYQVFLPLFHVVGMSWSVLPSLWAGATVVLQPRFSASRFWPAALEHRSTISSQVQFMTRLLAQQPAPDGHCFRQWGSSLWMPEQEAHFGVRILGWWGMTELVSQGIIGDPHAPQLAGTIGHPSLGYAVRVMDDAGQPVQTGALGHLEVRGVRGVSLFAEYYNNPQATAEAFDADGWFRTGDVVLVHEDGSIRFADRAKDVIKVGGENVSAAEVESIVGTVAGVRECAVVAKPDPVYGEVAVAFVALHADAPEAIEERIIEHCRAALSKFKVPREVIVIGEMPRVNGTKIGKAELRRRLDAGEQRAPGNQAIQ